MKSGNIAPAPTRTKFSMKTKNWSSWKYFLLFGPESTSMLEPGFPKGTVASPSSPILLVSKICECSLFVWTFLFTWIKPGCLDLSSEVCGSGLYLFICIFHSAHCLSSRPFLSGEYLLRRLTGRVQKQAQPTYALPLLHSLLLSVWKLEAGCQPGRFFYSRNMELTPTKNGLVRSFHIPTNNCIGNRTRKMAYIHILFTRNKMCLTKHYTISQ